MKKQDQLYASPLEEIIDFRFDERVVDVFADMIQRSVPGYSTLISTIGVLAGQYAQPASLCYDLGCSLGAVSLSMRHRITQPDCHIIAVDNSLAMIEKGRQLLAADSATTPVSLICANIQDIRIQHASVVVLNFTLQFIDPKQRLSLIQRIYEGLKPGGILVLSEKIAFRDKRQQAIHTAIHHHFKRSNGYSDLEISQKRTALEHVLIPETEDEHYQRLRQAGFGFIDTWFQCFNFLSMMAIK